MWISLEYFFGALTLNNFFSFRSFTCNMHAFGLNRDLCNEFLRKQCTIANLTKGDATSGQLEFSLNPTFSHFRSRTNATGKC